MNNDKPVATKIYTASQYAKKICKSRQWVYVLMSKRKVQVVEIAEKKFIKAYT